MPPLLPSLSSPSALSDPWTKTCSSPPVSPTRTTSMTSDSSASPPTPPPLPPPLPLSRRRRSSSDYSRSSKSSPKLRKPKSSRHIRRSSSTTISMDDSVESLQAAIVKHSGNSSSSSLGALWNRLGTVHFRANQVAEATRAYEHAASMAGPHVASSLHNLGTAYWTCGNAKAVPTLQQAIVAYQLELERQGLPIDSSVDIASVQYSLGLCRAVQGEPGLALEELSRARRTFGLAKDTMGVGRTLLAMGRVAQGQGDYRQALEWHREAASLLHPTHLGTTAMEHVAECWIKMGQPQSALAAYQQVLLRQQHVGDAAAVSKTWRILAQLHEELHEPLEAAHCRHEANAY